MDRGVYDPFCKTRARRVTRCSQSHSTGEGYFLLSGILTPYKLLHNVACLPRALLSSSSAPAFVLFNSTNLNKACTRVGYIISYLPCRCARPALFAPVKKNIASPAEENKEDARKERNESYFKLLMGQLS